MKIKGRGRELAVKAAAVITVLALAAGLGTATGTRVWASGGEGKEGQSGYAIQKIVPEAFAPRLVEPTEDNEYYFGDKNIFNGFGYPMPNCTAYAYGRAYEIMGTAPNVSTGNAGKWWWYNITNRVYHYGSQPRLGAIACWDRYDQNEGHVAIVEAIDAGRVTLSESAWQGRMFTVRQMKQDASDYLTSYRFLGYIYIDEAYHTNEDNTWIYYVQSGDTLTSIAGRFNTTVDMLVALNGLTDPDKIYEGQALRIPILETASPEVKVLGAQKRDVEYSVDKTNPDMRFVTKLPASAMKQFDVVGMGTLVAKEAELGGRTLDLALFDSQEITVKKIQTTYLNTTHLSDENDPYYTYTAALWSVTEPLRSVKYTARAYLTYRDPGTGEEKTVYSEPVSRAITDFQ